MTSLKNDMTDLSSCCKADVAIQGGTTKWWECRSCKRACDLWTPKQGDLSPDGKASVATVGEWWKEFPYYNMAPMGRDFFDIRAILAEQRRRTLEEVGKKADALLEGQEWNHEAIDFWEELKAKL